MGNIRSFKELRVWQNAMDVAMKIFEVTKSFPNDKPPREMDNQV